MPLSLATVFADVPDPRRETENKLHLLTDIRTIATCAIIAGADGWEQIAEYGTAKKAFVGRFLELPNGIPSHDTFNRVFAKLDPDAFADRFGRWMASACEATGLVHVAIDGQSARRSTKGTFTGCLHLADDPGPAVGTRGRARDHHHSRPVGGPGPEGAVVTIDAAYCQKAVVEPIREQGGDYVVCVKGNQKGLRDAVAGAFERAGSAGFVGCDMAQEVGDGHGRHEERYVSVIRDPRRVAGGLGGVGAVARVGRERRVKGKANLREGHYYLTSLRAKAAVLPATFGTTGGIENGRHGCWTWRSGRTRAAPVPATRAPTWGCSGASPCRCSIARDRRAVFRPDA